MRPGFLALALALAGVSAGPLRAADEGTRLLRFPDVSRTHITFVYAGDIYVVGREGGTAQRLTAHDGLGAVSEVLARRRAGSPSAPSTSGTRQVYVMPAAGGDAAPAHVLQRRRPDAGARRHRLPRAGLDPGWQAGAGARQPRALRRARRAALPGAGRRRAGDAAGDPRIRRRQPLARRHRVRLHADRPRLPQLEALPRRPRAGRVDLRPRAQRLAPAHRLRAAATTSRPGSATRSTSPPTARRP